MKDIQLNKSYFFKEYAQKNCGLENPSLCEKDYCDCKMQSEISGLIVSIIPLGFRNYSIKELDGLDKEGNPVLSPQAVMDAKEKVSRYCWDIEGETEIERLNNLESMDTSQLEKASIIGDKIRSGKSVIIHGRSIRQIVEEDEKNRKIIKPNPSGKTFLAAVLTREAIKLRVKRGYSQLIYDWIDFSSLFTHIKEDGIEKVNYANCNWLVADDISTNFLHGSEAQSTLYHSVLDPFFAERIKGNMANVLVFKFDIIDNMPMIEKSLGTSITKIITNKDTLIIDLSQEE